MPSHHNAEQIHGPIAAAEPPRKDVELGDGLLWVCSPLPLTDALAKELDALGRVFFSEVVFFHRPSRTLIVADLVENISADSLPSKSGRALAKLAHIYGRALPSPEFRMCTTDADAARQRLEEIHAWPFERILLAHGDLITDNAHEVFESVIEHLHAEVSHRPPRRRALYEAFAKRQ